ncbi:MULTISPECIES: hypothetical protein [unclassified Kitasatospora]|uniref:hypothetical protein n=1 Tax=unclassified Kitasatospora TaxID=2633591 RepID=UPI0033F16E19
MRLVGQVAGEPFGGEVRVSEADLIRAEARMPDPESRRAPRWLPPHGRARAEAETADGLMTSPVITARPEWSIVEAARRWTARRPSGCRWWTTPDD